MRFLYPPPTPTHYIVVFDGVFPQLNENTIGVAVSALQCFPKSRNAVLHSLEVMTVFF